MLSNKFLQQSIDLLHNIKSFTDKDILTKETLNAAAICKMYDKLVFAEFRAKCKESKRVTLSIFNEAVSEYFKKLQKEQSNFDHRSKIVPINIQDENVFELPPLPNGLTFTIPPDYIYSLAGIVSDKIMANGKHKIKFVAYAPFFIIEHLKNINDLSEKFKLAIYNANNDWDFIIVSRYDLSDERKIVALSKYGLAVNSVIARDTITFISEFIRINIRKIPTTRIFNRIGWHNNFAEFIYPPKGKDYAVDMDNSNELNLTYQTKGDKQTWLSHYDKIKHYNVARLSFAAALAASFAEIINLRNMTLCVYGKSGGGKTAGVIKFPMSIHGNPKFIPTFNSTFNSLERRAIISNNMPFAVDELQNITNKFQLDNIDKFAHIIGEGISKGRAGKNDSVEPLKSFSTIALITGEQPLTFFHSDQGKKRRTIELHCNEVMPVLLAEKTHELVTEHFGLIGRDWIELIKLKINDIKSLYKQLKNAFKLQRPDAIIDHINFLAAAYTADMLFNIYFRNLKFRSAYDELFNEKQAYSILQALSSDSETNTTELAKNFIIEFIASRKKHFINDADIFVQDPIFGFINQDTISIYSYRLKDELKKAGFSPEKCIQDLLTCNFLESCFYNKTAMYKIQSNL